jgi:hypothetical protein
VKTKKKPAKLRGRAREVASKFVGEEIRTGKYTRAQAIAIGLSRARKATRTRPIDVLIDRYAKKT